MYELVERIFQGVSFIAIGGAIAMIVFFIFAPSILGVDRTQRKLDGIGKQLDKISTQLGRIADRLGGAGKNADDQEDE